MLATQLGGEEPQLHEHLVRTRTACQDDDIMAVDVLVRELQERFVVAVQPPLWDRDVHGGSPAGLVHGLDQELDLIGLLLMTGHGDQCQATVDVQVIAHMGSSSPCRHCLLLIKKSSPTIP